jgi:hypothetical protein
LESKFDSDEFKKFLVDELMVGEGKFGTPGFMYTQEDFRDWHYPVLAYSYDYACDSNFTLLTYYPEGRPNRRHSSQGGVRNHPVRVGYIKSTGRFYLLMDGFGSKLVDIYNRMRAENNGCPDFPTFFGAVTLISLAYSRGCPTVVESWRDISVMYSLQFDLSPSSPYWTSSDPPFRFFPARNESLLRAESLMNVSAWDFFAHDDFDTTSLSPPSICTYPDSTVATVTVYVDNPDLIQIATWRVTFSPEGEVLSMRYKERPPVGGCSWFSPYGMRDCPYLPVGDSSGGCE